MEQLLNKMSTLSEAKTVDGLVESLKYAKDGIKEKLPSHEKRARLLKSFEISLNSKRPKICASGLEGLQALVRDQNLLSEENTTQESDRLLLQLLKCLEKLPEWKQIPQIQCQVLTIIVQLISSGEEFGIDLQNVFSAVQICSSTFSNSEETSVRLAVRASITQILNSFTQNRLSQTDSSNEASALSDIASLISDLIGRLSKQISKDVSDILPSQQSTDELQLALDAIYAVISVLQPNLIGSHQQLNNALKGNLIPLLVCLLHGIRNLGDNDAKSKPSGRIKALLSIKMKSQISAPSVALAPAILSAPEISRSFYQVVEHLFRLFAKTTIENQSGIDSSEGILLLEILWREALLVRPLHKRIDAFRMVKRFCANTDRFIEFVELCAASKQNGFWLVTLQCLEECCLNPQSSSFTATEQYSQDIALQAVYTLNDLFKSISQLMAEPHLEERFSTVFYSNVLSHVTIFQRDDALISSEKVESKNKQSYQQQIYSSEMESSISTMFLDEIIERIPRWKASPDMLELDHQIQRFSIEFSEKINDDQQRENKSTTISLTPLSVYVLTFEVLHFLSASTLNSNALWTVLREKWGNILKIQLDEKLVLEIPLNRLKDHPILHAFRDSKTQNVLQALIDHCGDIPKVIFPITALSSSNEESKEALLIEWFRGQLQVCQETIFTVLRQFNLHSEKRASAIPNPLGSEKFQKDNLTFDGIEATFNTMESALDLAIRFRIGKQAAWVFERIGEEVALLENLRELTRRKKTTPISLSGSQDPSKRQWRMHNTDVMGVDLVLRNALEVINLDSSSAKHVIRCVEFIVELERWHFICTKSANSIYEPPTARPVGDGTIRGLITATTASKRHQNTEPLSKSTLSKVLDEFLTEIDNLMRIAAESMGSTSISALLDAIVSANENNLKYSGDKESNSETACIAIAIPQKISNCIAIQRISQLICSIAKGPLFKSMKAWMAVSEHLIECSRENFPAEVGRRAVDCIQDILNSLLVLETEDSIERIDGFNEILLHSLTRVVAKDSESVPKAKIETRLQILTILLSIVETQPDCIRSGMSELFETLKAFRVDMDDKKQPCDGESNGSKVSGIHSVAFDIIGKFLLRKNNIAFYPFLIDCIECYLCSTNPAAEGNPDDDEATFFSTLSVISQVESLILEALTNGTCGSLPSKYEKNLLNLRFEEFKKEPTDEEDMGSESLPELAALLPENNYSGMHPSQISRTPIHVKAPDGSPWENFSRGQVFIAEIILLLIETLVRSWERAPYPEKLVHNLASFLASVKQSELGSEFSSFCLATAILPAISKRLHSEKVNYSEKEASSRLKINQSEKFLKECIGAFVQLQLNDLLIPGNKWREYIFAEMLTLIVGCVSFSKSQFVAISGCSYLRHLIVEQATSAECSVEGNSDDWLPRFWELSAQFIWSAFHDVLFPVRKIASQFFTDSANMGGDFGKMKLTVKTDGTNDETDKDFLIYLQQMAKQVFEVGTQNVQEIEELDEGTIPPPKFPYMFIFDENRSNTVTNGTTNTGKPVADASLPSSKLSIGLDELITCLISHQMLLQLVHQLLCNGSSSGLLTSGVIPKPGETLEPSTHQRQTSSNWSTIPASAIARLLFCLDATIVVCEHFDSRPALKKLLQQLSGLRSISNMYKPFVVAHSLRLQCLFKLATDEKCGNEDATNGKKYLNILDATFSTLFCEYQQFEQISLKNKISLFLRQRMDEQFDFALVESEDATSGDKVVKILKTKSCLDDFKSRKRLETVPQTPQSAEPRKNPFTSKASTSFAYSSDSTMFNPDAAKIMPHYLEDIDLKLVLYGEIFVLFVEEVLRLDKEKTKKALPFLGPKVRKFLCLSGTTLRARTSVAKFVEFLEENIK